MVGQEHFSHAHPLTYHQLPKGDRIVCSGCKSSGTGTVYVCWQCSFFLHVQCFHASRFLEHPSHPSHPLSLTPYPTYPSHSFRCNSCQLIGTGFSYSCSFCQFDIHVHCAYNAPNSTTDDQSHSHAKPQQNYIPIPKQISSDPNARESVPNHFLNPQKIRGFEVQHCYIPQQALSHQSIVPNSSSDQAQSSIAHEIRHKSHPNHPLTLLSNPPYESGKFTCNACFKVGYHSNYHCAACQFDLHVRCASLPETVRRDDHQHPLQLVYSGPLKGEGYTYMCDVCRGTVSKDCWVYSCEKCDFGTHLDCVNSAVRTVVESLPLELVGAQLGAMMRNKGAQAALDLLTPETKTYEWKYKYI